VIPPARITTGSGSFFHHVIVRRLATLIATVSQSPAASFPI
jgi:hypothetical protein